VGWGRSRRVVGYTAHLLLGPVIGGKVDQRIEQIGLTPNQVAAYGPLPGDPSLYAKKIADATARKLLPCIFLTCPRRHDRLGSDFIAQVDPRGAIARQADYSKYRWSGPFRRMSTVMQWKPPPIILACRSFRRMTSKPCFSKSLIRAV